MSALPNIPPFWSALAYWLACLLYVFMLPRRWGRARTACAAAALLAGLAAYMTLTANWQGWRFNIGMLGTAALNALTFFVLSPRDLAQRGVLLCPCLYFWVALRRRWHGSCMH